MSKPDNPPQGAPHITGDPQGWNAEREESMKPKGVSERGWAFACEQYPFHTGSYSEAGLREYEAALLKVRTEAARTFDAATEELRLLAGHFERCSNETAWTSEKDLSTLRAYDPEES